MSALTFNLIRIAYLVLLWLFVLFSMGILRRDLVTKARGMVSGRRDHRRGKVPMVVAAPVGPPAAAVMPSPGVPLARASNVPVAASNNALPGAALPNTNPTPRELIVTAGPLAGTRLPLGNSAILVGRAPDNALVINDGYASSRHARFFPQSGQWLLEDMNSTNGTFIDGQRVQGIVPLSQGQSIQIGQAMIELR